MSKPSTQKRPQVPKPLGQEPRKENGSWQEHPIAVAAITACATSVFFVTVVMPIWNKKEINRVEELETKLAPLESGMGELKKSLEGKIDAAHAERNLLENQISAMRLELEKLRRENMFQGGIPYPAGYREIKVGDSVDRVREIYKQQINEDLEDWISISLGGSSFFSSITFYKSDDGKKVTHLLFHLKAGPGDKVPSEVMYAKVVAYAGNPDFVAKVNGRAIAYCWEKVAGANLAVDPYPSSGYTIYGPNHHSVVCANGL